jgi:hypothetical protein
MLRNEAAIGNFDRVAFCPLAGHLTSSYWIASRQPSGPWRTEIQSEALDLPLLNQISGLFDPSSGHFLHRGKRPFGHLNWYCRKQALPL